MSRRIDSINPSEVNSHPHRFFRRKYVWQWPIRIFHWVNATCVVVLFATGLYIAEPILAPAGEAYKNFTMGTVRQFHFAFAYIFVVNFLWRIYWFYTGNNYARSGFPMIWDKQWRQDLFRQIVDYFKLHRGHVHLGHNALGGLAYTIFVVLLGWLQILSGFAMYSESNPDGWMNAAFGWIIVLVGGSFQLHMWHHLFAYGFLVFTILHLYIIFYDGQIYKNGLTTSMVSGVKFYQEGDLDNDRWLS